MFSLVDIQSFIKEKNEGEDEEISLPTVIGADHSSIIICCFNCGTEIVNGSENLSLNQMEKQFVTLVLTDKESVPLNFDKSTCKCSSCDTQLGTLQSRKGSTADIVKLFWNNVFAKNEGKKSDPLIGIRVDEMKSIPFSTVSSLKPTKEPNSVRFPLIIERHKAEENKLKENVSNPEAYSKYLRDSEISKRTMFRRLHNLKMSDEDLENDQNFNRWLFWYRDKNIPSIYQNFNHLLDTEFKSSIRAARKIEEIIKGHILEYLQNNSSVKRLKELIESRDQLSLRRIMHANLFGDVEMRENFQVLPYSSSVCEECYKDKYFCFIDLAKANFTTLKSFDPTIFGDKTTSWRDYLNKETNFELFHQFHYTIRHPVFGKLNFGYSTHKMIEIAEHELLNVLYNQLVLFIGEKNPALLSNCCEIKQCASDAFFFCFDSLPAAHDLFEIVAEFDSKIFPAIRTMIHLSVFRNHYYYFEKVQEQQAWFVIKETIYNQEVTESPFTICAVQLEDRPFIEDHFEKALKRVKENKIQD